MKNLPLKELLEKYNSGNCTEQERVWVENWYFQNQMSSPFPISEKQFEQDIKEVSEMLPVQESIPIKKKQWLSVAATFMGALLIIGLGLYVHEQRQISEQEILVSQAQDLEPGGNAAQLRLADNSVILLNNLEVGQVYQHPGFRIRKTESGLIEYLRPLEEKDSESVPVYNEISTPNGGQYQVLLPDGSKVWLNASTTLTYPIQFSPHERLVELTGEAYFEVSKSSVPFYVQTQAQKIEVLGTHFNVSAYENEQRVKTTLLEGSVRIVSALKNNPAREPKEMILKPGEQSILTKNDLKVNSVDVAQAIAWKNGFFSFQGTDIKEVMRELSRWYNVEVQFVGSIPSTKLWGEMYRNVKASEALQILEYFDMKFEIVTDKEVSRIEISKK